MNRLKKEQRTKIIAALVEGNSLRATARMCGVAFNTVLKLLPEIGAACEEYQRRVLVNLPCKRIQCDEIWGFCYAKATDHVWVLEEVVILIDNSTKKAA